MSTATASNTKPAKKKFQIPTYIYFAIFCYFSTIAYLLITSHYETASCRAAAISKRQPLPPGQADYGQNIDIIYAVCAGVIITLVRSFVNEVSQRIGAMVLGPIGTIKKFSESFWKLFAYSIVFGWGISFIPYKSYASPYNTHELWQSYPNATMDINEHGYYIVQMGYYIHMIVTVFTDVRRSDFIEYVIHHFVTLFLVVFSYSLGHFRIGILILLCHDINDVLLELAKLFRYVNLQTMGLISFALFAIVWLLARLIYFPFVLIRSVIFEGCALVSTNLGCCPYYFPFILLLLALLILHIYWFYLILKIIVKALRESEAKDIREEDSDNEDEDEPSKKKD